MNPDDKIYGKNQIALTSMLSNVEVMGNEILSQDVCVPQTECTDDTKNNYQVHDKINYCYFIKLNYYQTHANKNDDDLIKIKSYHAFLPDDLQDNEQVFIEYDLMVSEPNLQDK